MRILGVDPGTKVTGWGLVVREGTKVLGVAAGVIHAPGKRPLEERLKLIHDGLTAVIVEHTPDVFAVEDMYSGKYANAAIRLGHVRGVALLVAANSSLPVHAYPPAVVKKTVAGRGRADKTQVAHIVGAILGWKELPAADATDALAVAITHAQAAGFARAQRR